MAPSFDIAVEKLEYKSWGTDQIVAELIKAGGETHSEIHKLICCIWNKEEMPQHWIGWIMEKIA